jgi:hypothetical protein
VDVVKARKRVVEIHSLSEQSWKPLTKVDGHTGDGVVSLGYSIVKVRNLPGAIVSMNR